jgi:hypothetical protein
MGAARRDRGEDEATATPNIPVSAQRATIEKVMAPRPG